ncbi:hypothetical protein CAP35_13185 [Chitinophagaceae bacterium IBVUCB1]|jgi:predicted DNA-binding protein (UPF0251 family)|nr:hypothetical protein CAP35_13185 [Chitinophagaceae bacterium IBVUCB1]
MTTEKFSATEKHQLRKCLQGYGAKQDCATKAGIHRSTITRVLKTGEATTTIARKLRQYIQATASRVFVEEAA